MFELLEKQIEMNNILVYIRVFEMDVCKLYMYQIKA